MEAPRATGQVGVLRGALASAHPAQVQCTILYIYFLTLNPCKKK